MSKLLTEQLYVNDGLLRKRLMGDPPFKPAIECGSLFDFQIYQKQVYLGDLPITQFWMNTSGLYGNQKKRPPNFEAIIGYYWAKCYESFTIVHEAVQESFLLANLLPHIRKKGSRRVFEDSGQWRSKESGQDKTSLATQLDEWLRDTSGEELSEIKFRDKTGDVVGPCQYPDEVWEQYRLFVSDILVAGRQALEAEGEIAGIQVAEAAWNKKMANFGRHRGHKTEKLVLDILSYEARAAFHRCYSAVWCDLLPHLADKFKLTDESVLFHKLWHLDIQKEAEGTTEANFHLFHASIFALHPASGNFMRTTRGPQLIGQWLQDPASVQKYQQLLYGIFVALLQYSGSRQSYAESRKKESYERRIDSWTDFEQELIDDHSRRKKSGIRDTDAR